MTKLDKYDDILHQNGKTFHGVKNPNKMSKVKIVYFNEKGTQVCSAKRASGKLICASTATMSSGRCKMHGGASLTGMESPRFKTGKFSRSLPARLAERYEEGLSDEKLQDFTDDLAVIDARIDDLFKQMEEGGGGDIFAEVKDAYRSFNYASKDGDKMAMREALRRLDDAIKRGSGETYLWSEIRSEREQKRKLVLAQAKYLQMTNQTITVVKANLIIAALLDAVRKEITDPSVLGRISRRFTEISNRAGGNSPKKLKS